MECCVLSENIIKNIIVCENDEIAAQFGAVPSYEGARIGDSYQPPPEPEPQATDTEVLNALLGVSE